MVALEKSYYFYEVLPDVVLLQRSRTVLNQIRKREKLFH